MVRGSPVYVSLSGAGCECVRGLHRCLCPAHGPFFLSASLYLLDLSSLHLCVSMFLSLSRSHVSPCLSLPHLSLSLSLPALSLSLTLVLSPLANPSVSLCVGRGSSRETCRLFLSWPVAQGEAAGVPGRCLQPAPGCGAWHRGRGGTGCMGSGPCEVIAGPYDASSPPGPGFVAGAANMGAAP